MVNGERTQRGDPANAVEAIIQRQMICAHPDVQLIQFMWKGDLYFS